MEEVLLKYIQPGIKQGTKIYVLDLLCILLVHFLSGIYFGFFSPGRKRIFKKMEFVIRATKENLFF